MAQNLTFANLPSTVAGESVADIRAKDIAAKADFADVQKDVPFIANDKQVAMNWGWYQDGYDREPNEPKTDPADGSYDSYIGHHNGPQYFN